jgi:integral membrane protein
MNLTTLLGQLRLFAVLEGISYLLFAVTMPLKYVYNLPEPNYFVGMAHGILFLGYIFLCLRALVKFRWGFTTGILVLGASLVPFGTFVADKKVFSKEQRATAA